MLQTLEDAADMWLCRPRNPHVDAEILDTVQRRQESQPTSPATEPPSPPTVCRPARLIKLVGQQAQAAWDLALDSRVLVGRSGKKNSTLDINLWPDTGVSRRHALLWFDGEGWCIEDLNSTNGTRLDDRHLRGQRVTHVTMGTRIQCGSTILVLAMSEGEDAPPAAGMHHEPER